MQLPFSKHFFVNQTTIMTSKSNIDCTSFRPVYKLDKNTSDDIKSNNTKNFSNIKYLVDTFVETNNLDIREDNTDDLPKDDPYFSRNYTWEESFEDTYSPYNSDNYLSDDDTEEEINDNELGCETIRW